MERFNGHERRIKIYQQGHVARLRMEGFCQSPPKDLHNKPIDSRLTIVTAPSIKKKTSSKIL